MQFLFVDSNLFLQCRPLKDLDWNRFCGQEEVTLLIPSAVLTELDKHKSDGNSRRAHRARQALQLLDSILASPDDLTIIREKPAKVIARFAPGTLSQAGVLSNDDSILSEVAEFSRSEAPNIVCLVTHDTNLKVKAKRAGLRFFPVPDEWLLPPEPDERDRRVKQLEEQVALLRKQSPNISVQLDGAQEIELSIPAYEPMSSGTVDRLIKAMTTKYPMKTDFSLNSPQQLSIGDLFKISYPPSNEEIAKYRNEEYPHWQRNLRSRLVNFHRTLHARDTTVDVRLLIANGGTVPGSHVEIAVRVSNRFINIDPERYDKMLDIALACPEAPQPPQPRQSSLGTLGRLHELRGLSSPHLPSIALRRKRDEFYLRNEGESNSELAWECENMRHGGPPREFYFKLGVEMQSRPSGGQMLVIVSAENLPTAVEQRFRIKTVHMTADTEAAAVEWLGLDSD